MSFWHPSRWHIEGKHLVMPNGWRVPLLHIRDWRTDLITGNADLTGHWSGWRMRRQYLIPPGGSIRRTRITAAHLKASLQWDHRAEPSSRQLPLF